MVPSENDHGLIGKFCKIRYYLIFGLTWFGYVHFFQENRSVYSIKSKIKGFHEIFEQKYIFFQKNISMMGQTQNPIRH